MALAFSDFLKSAEKRRFEPGYLIAGNELYLRDRFRQTLVQAFLGGQREDVVEHDLAEVPVRDALDDAASIGLFARSRVVWLRNAEAMLPRRRAAAAEDDDAPATASKHSPESIADYFARPQQSSIVVFEATALDVGDRDDLRRCERLEKLLPVASVHLERLPPAQAAKLLVEEARKNGFQFEEDAARELADACACDLARASRELEKLMLYCTGSGSRISSEQVQLLVPAEASFTLWEISDAIGDRDAARALRLVRDMLRQDTPPLLLASLIAGQIRKLLKAREGAREWVHPRVKEQARKFTVAELTRALEKMYEADVALRSSPPEERVVLEKLVLELAKKR